MQERQSWKQETYAAICRKRYISNVNLPFVKPLCSIFFIACAVFPFPQFCMYTFVPHARQNLCTCGVPTKLPRMYCRFVSSQQFTHYLLQPQLHYYSEQKKCTLDTLLRSFTSKFVKVDSIYEKQVEANVGSLHLRVSCQNRQKTEIPPW